MSEGAKLTVTIVQQRVRLTDPHDCTDAMDDLTILRAVFDTLVRRDGRGFVPGLAQSWSTTDATSWEFQLRPQVQFHDGTACDADAVRQSLERMARPDKGYTLGSPAVWRQYLGDARIEVTGPLTLRVHLAQPMADLLDVLDQGFIISPGGMAARDGGQDHGWVGTGPYRLVQVEPDHIVAERVENHFAGTAPNAQVVWQACPNPADRLAQLLDGRAQVASRLSPTDRGAVAGPAFTWMNSLSPVAIIYLLNVARGPLINADLRRALSLAIDRNRLVADTLDGAARPLFGFVSPAHFGAAVDPDDPYDPDAARALLMQAGYTDGLTLNVDCPTQLPDEAVKLTACLAEQLGQIGVSLDVKYHEDREAYAHQVRRKEIGDMCVFDSSPLSTYRVLHEKIDGRVAGAWWEGYRNGRVEQMLDRARQITDATARSGLYQNIYRSLQDDPPWLTLYNPMVYTGLAGRHPDVQLPVDCVLDVARLPDLAA